MAAKEQYENNSSPQSASYKGVIQRSTQIVRTEKVIYNSTLTPRPVNAFFSLRA
jgi:hypothetical protein